MAMFLLKAICQGPKGKFTPENCVKAFFAFRETQKDLGISIFFCLVLLYL